jgi:carbonic anhydrase
LQLRRRSSVGAYDPREVAVGGGLRVGQVVAKDPFADVLAANAEYVTQFRLAGLEPVAARGLAVLTCMDSRIEPLAMLGLAPGDAKIVRNAGARVTDDVLRTFVVARHLLGVERIMVVAHTGCRMAGLTEQELHDAVLAAGGPDTRHLSFLVATDQAEALRSDVARVQSSPFLADTASGGFLYDVDSGRLSRVC